MQALAEEPMFANSPYLGRDCSGTYWWRRRGDMQGDQKLDLLAVAMGMTANLGEARTHEPGWTLDHGSASGLPIGGGRAALGDSGAALRLASLGGSLHRSLHRVLASA